MFARGSWCGGVRCGLWRLWTLLLASLSLWRLGFDIVECTCSTRLQIQSAHGARASCIHLDLPVKIFDETALRSSSLISLLPAFSACASAAAHRASSMGSSACVKRHPRVIYISSNGRDQGTRSTNWQAHHLLEGSDSITLKGQLALRGRAGSSSVDELEKLARHLRRSRGTQPHWLLDDAA